MKRIIPYALAFIGVILISFGLLKTLQFQQFKKILMHTEFNKAREKMEQNAAKASHFVALLQPLVENFAEFASGSPTKETIIKGLEKRPIEVAGLGIITDTLNLYYVEHEDQQQLVSIPKDWVKHIKTTHAAFLEPAIDPITGEHVIVYAAPVYGQNKKQIGTAFATQSATHINHVLANTDLGKYGYWFIINRNKPRLLITHPKKALLKDSQKHTELEWNQVMILSVHLSKYLKDKDTELSYKNEITGHESWLFFAPIKHTPWMIGGVFDKQELPIDTAKAITVFYNNQILRQKIFFIIIFLLSGVLVLCFLLAMGYKNNPTILWTASFLASLAILLSLIALWATAKTFSDYKETLNPIKTKSYLYTQLADYEDDETQVPKDEFDKLDWFLKYRYKKGKYVPTGILINDINFVDNEQIEFTAIVWQRYFDGIHDGVSRGFVLPQAAGAPDIVELSRAKEGNTETIQWLVRAKVNQDISYKKYPFDFKELSIQFWHKDFEKNIVLVPDLDSYKIIHPRALPGIAKSVFMPDWHIHSSFFNLQKEFYHTTFGMYHYGPFGIYKETEKSDRPDLFFNVTAIRDVLNSINIDLLTLFVIIFILFMVLLSYQALGLSWTLGSITTAFFSTILAQVRFRGKILSNEFVYFETFYLLIYVIIIAILLVTVLDLHKVIRNRWLKNNFITKLLYWPVCLLSMLLISVYYLF